MLIDWFTVIAQTINFLVLVWLLKRFLYRPILNAIDAREKRIAEEISDADSKRKEAEHQKDLYQKKNAEFDKQQTSRMNELAEETKTERERLMEKVRLESEELRAKLQSALQNEQLSLKDELSQRVSHEVFSIARKALNDLAETSLEASMTKIFIRRLKALSDEERGELKRAFTDSNHALTVRSAFKLPSEQCKLIKTAIQEILGEDIQLEFITAAELVSGIEMSANGQKIAWSIANYLDSLGKSIEQLLQSSGNDQENAQLEKADSKQSVIKKSEKESS
jgi:F-type H+-transporting ATPase subunit b